MAWDDDMPLLLRVMTQDLSSAPTYTDEGLVQLLLTAGMMVQLQGAFAVPYTISISNETLSPDPTKLSPPDNAFIMLTVLRSSLVLVAAEIKQMVNQGIEIRDGTSMLKLQRDYQSLQEMQRVYQDQYDEALYAWKTGGGEALGQIIVTPYPLLSGSPYAMGDFTEGYPNGGTYGFGFGLGPGLPS